MERIIGTSKLVLHNITSSLVQILYVVGFGVTMTGSAMATTFYVDMLAAGTGDGSTWGNAYTTIQAGIDAAANGDNIWIAEGTYNEAITLKTSVGVYGGFSGDETLLSQRDFFANKTIIDATGLVTSAATMDSTTDALIDGFVILGGNATSGGGINIDSANCASHKHIRTEFIEPSSLAI